MPSVNPVDPMMNSVGNESMPSVNPVDPMMNPVGNGNMPSANPVDPMMNPVGNGNMPSVNSVDPMMNPTQVGNSNPSVPMTETMVDPGNNNGSVIENQTTPLNSAELTAPVQEEKKENTDLDKRNKSGMHFLVIFLVLILVFIIAMPFLFNLFS